MRSQILKYIPANVVPALVAFATIYVFTRFLAPAEYGDYSFALSSVMIGQAALFYPLTVGVTRIYPREERAANIPAFVKTAYAGLGIIDVVSGSVLILVYWLVPLGGAGKAALLLGIPLLLLRGLVSLNQSVNRMEGRVWLYTAIECSQPLVGMLAGAALIFALGPTAQAVMLGLVIAAFVCAVANARLLLAACRGGVLRRGLLIELARFGWPLALAFLTSCILQYADRFIVGTLGTISQLGVYAVAYSLVERPTTMLCTSVSSATFPLAVRALEHRGRDAAGMQAGRNGAVLLTLTVPACIGLALCSEHLARVLVGPDYRLAAAALIPIMAFTALARGISTHFVDHAFHLSHRPKLLLMVYAPTAAVNIILDIIFVPRFGMFAAAWIALGCQSLALIMGWLVGQRQFPLYLPRHSLVMVGVSTAAMASVLLSFRFPLTPIGLTAMVATGAATYVTVAALCNFHEIAGQLQVLLHRQEKAI